MAHEAVCRHPRLLDKWGDGDTVCLSCSWVVEKQLLGFCSGPGTIRENGWTAHGDGNVWPARGGGQQVAAGAAGSSRATQAAETDEAGGREEAAGIGGGGGQGQESKTAHVWRERDEFHRATGTDRQDSWQRAQDSLLRSGDDDDDDDDGDNDGDDYDSYGHYDDEEGADVDAEMEVATATHNRMSEERMDSMTKVQSVLEKFHMDSKDMVTRCHENFERIYGRRRTCKGFRKSKFKESVAVAASIVRQMVLLKMPRPPEHVASLCGLVNTSPLLRVDAVLNFSKEEKVIAGSNFFFCTQQAVINNCHF